MLISDREYCEIIDFLEANTDSTYEELTAITDMYQLKNIYLKTKERLERYPIEIYNHLLENPNFFHSYSLEELKAMNYSTLARLRKSLGIRGKNKKSSAFTFPRIEENQKRESTTQFERQKIVRDLEEQDRELQILTPEEIAFMYKGEEYTERELAEKGIVSDSIEYFEDQEEQRYNMIDTILIAELTIKGTQLEIEDLFELDEQELTTLYKLVVNYENKLGTPKRLK